MNVRMVACAVALVLSLAAHHSARAAVVHNENDINDGELSNDENAPTLLNVAIGDNTIIGTIADAQGSFNTDIFTFTVPTNAVWAELVIDDYQSSDNVAFIGIDDSNTFPYNTFELNEVDFGLQPADAFIGGTLFGPLDIGNDILARSAVVTGAGFSRPLPSGDYTIYMQQTGATTDYQVTVRLVSAVPEPGAAFAMLLAGTVVVTRRRARR